MQHFFASAIFIICALYATSAHTAEVSVTMDDANLYETPLLSAKERNKRILKGFDDAKIKAALFVCGMRVDSADGRSLLNAWDHKGHVIANHSYSHFYYNDVGYDPYAADFLKGDHLINGYKNFRKFFRFPFLKEGNTAAKIQSMRQLLKQSGYRNGFVTIDASDWYVDQRMAARLKSHPNADTKPYRDFYLKHIWNRANYYNELGKKVLGREVKHTLLIHHSLLNSLFLGDLLHMFRDKGWKLIDAAEAYTDQVFQKEPNIVPAGESIIWALAKETGRFDDVLRYPAEDSVYEKDEMDRLGL